MTSQPDPVTVVIQAGGTSSRMGEDKALRLFLGQPLITRVIERVKPLARELLIITNQPADYAFVSYKLITDIYPGRGPLGGLCTALHAASHDIVVIVGCDMPFVNVQLLTHQRDIMVHGNYDVVIPQSNEGLEPFHAVYQRANCLPAVTEALAADAWRMTGWLDQVRSRILEVDEVRQFDLQQIAFTNLNTPEEFKAAESWVGNQGEK